MFFAAVDLTDDLDGLARLVVQGKEEDRRVHHARGLLVESAEQLGQVARLGTERSEATRRLQSRAQLLICGSRVQHVPHRRRRGTELLCLGAKNIGDAEPTNRFRRVRAELRGA